MHCPTPRCLFEDGGRWRRPLNKMPLTSVRRGTTVRLFSLRYFCVSVSNGRVRSCCTGQITSASWEMIVPRALLNRSGPPTTQRNRQHTSFPPEPAKKNIWSCHPQATKYTQRPPHNPSQSISPFSCEPHDPGWAAQAKTRTAYGTSITPYARLCRQHRSHRKTPFPEARCVYRAVIPATPPGKTSAIGAFISTSAPQHRTLGQN